jgi:hypothetical protein
MPGWLKLDPKAITGLGLAMLDPPIFSFDQFEIAN